MGPDGKEVNSRLFRTSPTVRMKILQFRQAMERKESRGLHYTIDYPHAAEEKK